MVYITCKIVRNIHFIDILKFNLRASLVFLYASLLFFLKESVNTRN